MARKVEYGIVAAWLIAIGIGHHGSWVIGHDELWYATIKVQCAYSGFKPVNHGLAGRGTGECIAGSAHCSDEDVGTTTIGQCHGGAGEINEQLLTCAMDLPHRAFELFGKAAVMHTELGIAVGLTVGVIGTVLFPQQHQRHALTAQFLMHTSIVRLNICMGFLGYYQ